MYAYVIDNMVREIIPDVDAAFPGVPIAERYPAEVLDRCIYIKDDADVVTGMIYDPVTEKFCERTIVPVFEDIDAAKRYKITESKDKLADWLADHPMTYTDGKQYSVTAEKQSLLNGNLASYERAAKAGIEYPLRWNSTGDECTEWTYEALVGLSLAIAAYVAPKVSRQQEIELAIAACETLEQLNEIVISYE